MKGILIGLLTASLSGSLAALVLLALKEKLVAAFGGKWYYYLWIPVLLLFLLGPRPNVPAFSTWKADLARSQAVAAADAQPPQQDLIDDTATDLQTATSEVSPTARTAVIPLPSISTLLIALWLTGTLGFLCVTIFHYLRFLHRTLQREPVGTENGMDIYITAQVRSPVLVGFFHPKLILPDLAIPPEELALILRHEGVHWRRKDVWVKAAVLVVQAVHWFNPIVYGMARAISAACEYACDEAVTQEMTAQETFVYSQMILNVATGKTPALTLGFSDSAKQLKRRFSHMLTPKKVKGKGVASLVFAVMIASIFCFTTLALAEDSTLTDCNGGIYTYYNTAISLQKNIANTLGIRGDSVVSVVSSHYIDSDAKKVDTYNRTEPVYKVQIGWASKDANFQNAAMKTVDAAGKTVTYAFLGDTQLYQNDIIFQELVKKQIAFELSYQPDPAYGIYDHQAFIRALLEQGVYTFEKITPAKNFAPDESSVFRIVPILQQGTTQRYTGTIGLKVLTRYEEEPILQELWNGNVWVNRNLDGGQGVVLGQGITVNAGQTLAVDIKELTDKMPKINISIWDVTTNSTVDWIPTLTCGYRYYYTPGNDAGHTFNVLVSTDRAAGDLANIHAYLY